jgi:hypothetical protein
VANHPEVTFLQAGAVAEKGAVTIAEKQPDLVPENVVDNALFMCQELDTRIKAETN